MEDAVVEPVVDRATVVREASMDLAKEWFTLREVAKILGVHHSTLWLWRKQGRINLRMSRPGGGPRGYTRVHVSEVRRVLEEGVTQ